MSTSRFLTITVAALAITACNPFQRQQAVEVNTQDTELNTRWHANLASPASLAGAVQMSGSASMAPDPDGTHTNVTIKLGNASPGGIHPWAMHRGQCGARTDNGVVGPGDAYHALEVGSDGRATQTASIPMRTPVTGDYFVVVHASKANAGTVVACGNLAPPTR